MKLNVRRRIVTAVAALLVAAYIAGGVFVEMASAPVLVRPAPTDTLFQEVMATIARIERDVSGIKKSLGIENPLPGPAPGAVPGARR